MPESNYETIKFTMWTSLAFFRKNLFQKFAKKKNTGMSHRAITFFRITNFIGIRSSLFIWMLGLCWFVSCITFEQQTHSSFVDAFPGDGKMVSIWWCKTIKNPLADHHFLGRQTLLINLELAPNRFFGKQNGWHYRRQLHENELLQCGYLINGLKFPYTYFTLYRKIFTGIFQIPFFYFM